ncbi:MAG UNVERIFIED_CONTAM: hypothetical protein LVT10_06980 [Anaerolineae bacterium]|jgi:hypothetical protein
MADATEMGQAAGELGLTIPVLPSATGMENGKGEKRWGIRGVSRSKGESGERRKEQRMTWPQFPAFGYRTKEKERLREREINKGAVKDQFRESALVRTCGDEWSTSNDYVCTMM